MDFDEIMFDCEERMEKALDIMVKDLRGIRGGRATPALVEGIRVEYYGSPTPLKQLASISTPDPRLLVVKPFDSSTCKEIEKAINKADVGLPPNSDGKLSRLAIPPLSEERRRSLVGMAKDKVEEAKIAVRNVRRDANRNAETAEEDKTVTEDEAFKLKEKIQEMTKVFEKKIEDAFAKKEKEILEI